MSDENKMWQFDKNSNVIYREYEGDSQYKRVTLLFTKVRNTVTGKIKYRVDFTVVPNIIRNDVVETGENEAKSITATAYCAVLGLDKELEKLREYGLYLARVDIMDIEKVIEDNFMYFNEETEGYDDEDFENILCLYSGYFKNGEYEVPVRDTERIFRDNCDDKEVGYKEFKKWLIAKGYLIPQNMNKKTDSEIYTRVKRIENNTIRVYRFDKDKVDELLNSYQL